MPYQCRSCGDVFDFISNGSAVKKLVENASRNRGVGKAISQCPNGCFSLVIGIEEENIGEKLSYLIFTADVNTLTPGVEYPTVEMELVYGDNPPVEFSPPNS